MVLDRSRVNRLFLDFLLPSLNVLHHYLRFLLLVKLRVPDALVCRLGPLLVLLHEDILSLVFGLMLLQRRQGSLVCRALCSCCAVIRTSGQGRANGRLDRFYFSSFATDYRTWFRDWMPVFFVVHLLSRRACVEDPFLLLFHVQVLFGCIDWGF